MEKLDARGLSCPEPVIMIRKAMLSGGTGYEMTVDNLASRENVTRYAQHQGYTVSVTEQDGEYTLTMTK
ncbi:MAG: preprotein translocase subunit TatB [Oscillibacter sp.]|nr:preprotein translocase subunit TatB [Oscillibacter sp.]